MKLKSFFPILAVGLSLILLSWGYTGHRTIGVITENHLSSTAKTAVKGLLGDTSIADACTWADDARKEPQFANTANWHFLNLPVGLSFVDFKHYIDTLKTENVYTALINAEKQLADKNSSKQQKIHALKFMMHFVGDLHQPMHISREEDKGGNTIQVNYNDKGTNLHSLWDTRMLEKEGLTYTQLAAKFDTISEADIKQWQSDPIILWMWESYQISTALYAEIEQMDKKVIDDTYYQKHMPTVQKRMQQSAIRLAGLLNKTFK
ncbi:MAG: S1/P1 nuclease [Pedobacter sp.]|nr:S1/P1 nuclease [Pedobacter sp.]